MSRSTRRFLLALAIGSLTASGVLGINHSWLTPGASADSVTYLSAARSLARHGNFDLPYSTWSSPDSVSTLAHFPPGFPVLIAAVMRLHVRAQPAALWVMAVSSGTALALAFLLLADTFGLTAGLVASLLFIATPVFVKLNMAIWSEPTYLAVTAAMLYVMLKRPSWGLVYGLLAAAALSVRYVGVAGALAAVVWAALHGRGRKGRLIAALVAGLPSVLFVGWWTHHVAGAGGTIRRYGYYGGLGRNLHDLAGTLVEWLVPTPWHAGLAAAFLVLLLGGLLIVEAVQTEGWRPERRRELGRLFGLYGVLYLAVVLGSRLLADPRIPFDARLFLPVLMLATLAVGASLVALAGRRPRGLTLMVLTVVALWTVASAAEIGAGVRVVNRVGRYYTFAGWVESPVIRWIDNDSRAYDVIYSNEPELVYFQTGRHARRLPDTGADLGAFERTFRDHHAAIVIAYPLHLGNLPARVFARALDLRAAVRTDLGAVYVPDASGVTRPAAR